MTELGEFDPLSMNHHGDIAGTCVLEGSEPQIEPVLYRPGKGMTILPRPGSMPLGVAFGISEDGKCAGVVGDFDNDLKAAVWEQGSVRLLSQRLSIAYGVNSQGQAVGMIQRSRNAEAVLWDNNQEVFLNDAISRSDGDLVVASHINERGQIAGYGIQGGKLFGYVLTPEKK